LDPSPGRAHDSAPSGRPWPAVAAAETGATSAAATSRPARSRGATCQEEGPEVVMWLTIGSASRPGGRSLLKSGRQKEEARAASSTERGRARRERPDGQGDGKSVPSRDPASREHDREASACRGRPGPATGNQPGQDLFYSLRHGGIGLACRPGCQFPGIRWPADDAEC
jgi:hypothetical protein